MSRRSKRLGTTEHEDDRISNSSVESHLLYRDSPARSLRRKVTTVKRLPIPRQPTEHSYYSETSTYVSRDTGDVSEALQGTGYEGSYWGDRDLVRKRTGLDVSYNRFNDNGLSQAQPIYDRSNPSSGYSSEEENAGHSKLDQESTRVSRWRKWIKYIETLPWLLLSYPGRVFGILYWWLGTTWYRLTTSASLLDVFILTRHYALLKKVLMILLILLLATMVATGLWHFYPYGLQGLIPLPIAPFSWKQKPFTTDAVAKENSGRETQPLFSELDLISRIESLERKFQGLENHQKMSSHREAGVATASGFSKDEIIQSFKDLSSYREATLKEEILHEGATMTENNVRKLREEQQGNIQGILQKMDEMSKEVDYQILQLRTELKSPSQEDSRENFLHELLALEEKLLDIQDQILAMRNTQDKMAQQVDAVPANIQDVKDEVQLLFPRWLMAHTDPKLGEAASLSKHFLHRNELEKYLLDLERKIMAELSADRKQWAKQAHNTIDRELQAGGISGVSREEVHEIVNNALQRYSEDRIGMVDYALESSGASVISTRCSETYETKTALFSLFGVPLWYHSQSPRVILQPDSNPGNCWAFRGSQGYAVIHLSSRIRPTAVTLDHIPRSLSPKATISSAPKDFSVYGLQEETQEEGVLLGNFTYNQNGEPIQTFPIQGDNMSIYELVELRIKSNWGHPEYTCVYRFRVHGEAEM
ncbi:SUN domain-containing protein 2 [Spea bombifrons]|uniref:SUN domain-containing protein 2 n=1 Tax=Spea bombifrons TaxID=233779 RepID=UPI002349C364|nr:SUN domain-containing protein 2 [Spea bombifrons]